MNRKVLGISAGIIGSIGVAFAGAEYEKRWNERQPLERRENVCVERVYNWSEIGGGALNPIITDYGVDMRIKGDNHRYLFFEGAWDDNVKEGDLVDIAFRKRFKDSDAKTSYQGLAIVKK